MIEIIDKNDGVRKLYRCREDYVPLGTQEAEPTAEYGVLKLTIEIKNRRNENILRRTYEDYIPLETPETSETQETQETEPTEPTAEPTEPTEPTETEAGEKTGEEIE